MSYAERYKLLLTIGLVLSIIVGCSAPVASTPTLARATDTPVQIPTGVATLPTNTLVPSTSASSPASTNSPVPPTAAPSNAVNLSQDLVRLGIAGQNLIPNNPQLDARPLFQAGVQYVASHHIPSLTIDRGNYYFLTPQTQVSYLSLSKLSDLVIDLAGSTIYFKGAFLQGFALSQSQHVTLTNFQTDFVNPPYTHVELTSIDANGRKLSYKTLPNWVDPATFSGTNTPFGKPELWAVIFRNGSIVPGTSRTQVKDPIASGVLELTSDNFPWTQSATLATLKPGDVVVVTQRVGQPPIKVLGGDAITLSNISVFGSSSWAIELDDTSNSIVDHAKVMPRPGVGLIGSNGDGIHFHYARQNNTVRNSFVTHTVDDAISIDSLYLATILRQSGPRQLHVKRNIFERFPNGTRFNLVDPTTAQETNGATIVSQDPPDSDTPIANGEVDLTLDQDLPNLPVGTGIVFATADARGAGSVIEDNIVSDIFLGRGIWVSGADGVTVQRNSIQRTSNGGITVSHDTADYPGPPARNVVIQNNSIVGSLGPMASGSGSQTALASIIVVSLDNKYGFSPVSTNTNVTIRNNYVADSGRAGVWLGEISGGTVQDNVIVRWNQKPELPYFGVSQQTRTQLVQDATQSIVSRIAANVNAKNNLTEMSSTLTGAVTFDRSSISLPSKSATTGSFTVQSNVPNFAWRAISDSNWLAINPPAFGTGSGSVQFSVSENATGSPRTGTIMVGGVNFVVSQP